MKLRQLLKGVDGVTVRGSQEVEILGVASDSRIVAPGDLFIARGGEYIVRAVDAGAKAVVTDVYDPFLAVTQVICKAPKQLEAFFAARYFGSPSQKLWMVGVTGSKGKTTTAYLVRHVLEGLGIPCGLMGTVETILGRSRFASTLTTQDPIFNQKALKEMVLDGCKAAVLEVSSHGLAQGRVDQIAFDVGIFTNLYPDHLDYHKTMEEYVKAKERLFEKVLGVSIVNADSFWKGRKGITIGIESAADLRAENIAMTECGLEFFVQGVRFRSCLLGRFNVYNLLSAIAVGVARGESLEKISGILENFSGVPGRLERVANTKGMHVFVDYAHTGESLEQVLRLLKEFAKAKIIVVFGCGGDRDPARRKSMGQAADKYADISIVTTDNSRSEKSEDIVREILAGFASTERVCVELDRRQAILRAVHLARAGDIVLIAGKGHEKVQIFKDKTVPFDDVATLHSFLEN